MKYNKKLKKAFGMDEFGFIDLPEKISGVKVSRVLYWEKMGRCRICFPHGEHTVNSTHSKNTRSWKKNRSKQRK